LTVEQYAAKFIELSRFAPYLISTEDLKARKFERGLQPRIMNQVVGFEISNLSDLISKASVIERTFKINAEYFNQRKRHPSNLSNKEGVDNALRVKTVGRCTSGFVVLDSRFATNVVNQDIMLRTAGLPVTTRVLSTAQRDSVTLRPHVCTH
jgi:hypothetical protein